MIVVKENADLGLLGGWGTFDGISLEKVGYGWGLVPDWIVEVTVDASEAWACGWLGRRGFPQLGLVWRVALGRRRFWAMEDRGFKI